MTHNALRSVATLLLALLPALVAAAESSSAAAKAVAPGELSVERVSALLARRDKIHVFDNNGPDRYAAGHVPGAIWLKFNAVEAGNLPPDKSATLVFYCANESCTASDVAARSAIRLGYRKVFIMPAGIMGWEKAGKPVEKSPRPS